VTVELSIIIVNWNSGGLLRRCVESIVEHRPAVPCEIIVVDNASHDRSADWLRDEGDCGKSGELHVRVVHNDTNVGFGRACNQAILSSSAPFVFLLNPDTEVQDRAIDLLIDNLKSDRLVGASAPRLLNEDGTVQPNVWASEIPYPFYVLLDGLGLYRLLPRRLRARLLRGRHWDHSERGEVKSFSGAAIMARREMIDRIGAFDERFEMYGEDAEWCSRMVRGGWKLIFDPAAHVLHHGGQSAAKRWTIGEQRLQEEEANLRFQRQSLSRFQFTVNTLSSAFVLAVLRLRAKLRHRSVEHLDAVFALKLSYLRQLWREREG